MSRASNRIPELLAPAGGPKQLRAAIANGADAVYLGVEVLNARRGATNFTLATLAETCRFAHIRGVRVYLTVNVVVLPDEADFALALVDRAWAAGVDAVIVQDVGLLWSIRRNLPHVRIHASTQLNAHNVPTLEVLADLGVARVTLARETSIAEIEHMVSSVGIEVESFVHGALCMCYSGQCLMSSLIGRRSANRGLCAQPCRLPYELVDAEGNSRSSLGAHLLSPKDLAGLALLPQLTAAGVAALKIEGRMKSAEYVALVTGVYRSALDRAVAQPETFEPRGGERAALDEAFSRGFTEAYLLGERGNEMMSYRRPNNRGVAVGRVASVTNERATLAIERAVESGDTLEFWTSSGRFAQPAGKFIVEGQTRDSAPAGSQVEIALEDAASAGDRVFRVRNAALVAAAERTFADEHSFAQRNLGFSVNAMLGEALAVRVQDSAGTEGFAQGPVVELARTKALTAEEIVEHVGRLGGTHYRAPDWDIRLSSGVGVGFSSLHRVRRDALAAYEAALLAPWANRREAGTLTACPRAASRRRRPHIPDLVVSVADEDTAKACISAGADEVFVPADALVGVDEPVERVVPRLPRIVHDAELPVQLRLAKPGRRIVAANLGALAAAVKSGARVEADWPLNVVNTCSVQQMKAMGVSRVWLSPELSGRQVAQVTADSDMPLGIGVYGPQELMVTEHCILMSEGVCAGVCVSCSRRAQHRVLRDRKGYEFPVVTDVSGRSHLYNAVVLDLAFALGEIASAGIAAIRLDLDLDGTEAAAVQTRRFREILERLSDGIQPPQRDTRGLTTTGHYFRGVV